MRTVAVLACRNEAAYLPTCLHHLASNGIEFAIVDNGSTDQSVEIARSAEFKPFLVDIVSVPFTGVFELETMLRAKKSLADSVQSDWVMNLCPDEVPHANRQDVPLSEEIARFDRAGFNVVNFDEFVFLPVTGDWKEGRRGWQDLRHYYFFEPTPVRQMRLWKSGCGFSNVAHGGHRLDGVTRIAPESLALRHYIFRDQDHAFAKFPNRRFAERELARGWHLNRLGYPRENYRLPAVERLEVLAHPSSCSLSRARPWKKHYWDFRAEPA